MDSRLDFESERVSPGFFGEVDLGSKPALGEGREGVREPTEPRVHGRWIV